MRAVTYVNTGDASFLEVVERPVEEPTEGEVRIRVVESGVNPPDWKSRSGAVGAAALNHAIDDGALRIGEHAGLPIHRFHHDTAAARDAVERAAVGEVLITVSV